MDYKEMFQVKDDAELVEKLYGIFDEDTRLNRSKAARVEFITNTRIIEQYIKPGARILDVGAGAGEYSLYFARKGYDVSALELAERNIQAFRKKLAADDHIDLVQGNALDLSRYEESSFDAVLLFGPLYHLHDREDRRKCIKEAKRVCKVDGKLFIAFISNDAVFLTELMECPDYFINGDYNKETFRLDDVPFVFHTLDACRDLLKDSELTVLREVASDGVSELLAEKINAMDDESYTHDGIKKKHIWDATMVSRILQDESYIGTLICHKSDTNKINKTFRFTEPEEQFRHEDFFPVIISRDLWEQAQALLRERKEKNVRAGADKKVHRYSGLLQCQDCGRSFLGKRIKLKDRERVEYVCDTYHRYGKEHCTAHAVREETLDELIINELIETKAMYQMNWDMLEKVIEKWMPKASFADAQISKLCNRIAGLEEDVEVILMERIRDKANAERYDRMIEKREAEIAAAKKQIEELQNISEVLRSRQTKLKKDISLIDEILKEGKMSEAHLRLLVDKILVHEHDGKIDLDIRIKAPFLGHTDYYEDGEIVERWGNLDFDWDRLAHILYGDYVEK